MVCTRKMINFIQANEKRPSDTSDGLFVFRKGETCHQAAVQIKQRPSCRSWESGRANSREALLLFLLLVVGFFGLDLLLLLE